MQAAVVEPMNGLPDMFPARPQEPDGDVVCSWGGAGDADGVAFYLLLRDAGAPGKMSCPVPVFWVDEVVLEVVCGVEPVKDRRPKGLSFLEGVLHGAAFHD